MSDPDTDKLKRLAELLRFGDTSGEYSKAILALIAENERLKQMAHPPKGWAVHEVIGSDDFYYYDPNDPSQPKLTRDAVVYIAARIDAKEPE